MSGSQTLPFEIVLDTGEGCPLYYLDGGFTAVFICRNPVVCTYKMNALTRATYASMKVFLRAN